MSHPGAFQLQRGSYKLQVPKQRRTPDHLKRDESDAPALCAEAPRLSPAAAAIAISSKRQEAPQVASFLWGRL